MLEVMYCLRKPLQHPLTALTFLFLSWKAFLLFVAICSPGKGYDTSTALILNSPLESETSNRAFALSNVIANKLIRWDAIYFIKVANRGYQHEQEWAFGWGITYPIAFVTAIFRKFGLHNPIRLESLVGIGITHVFHGLSVYSLYGLTRLIFPDQHNRKLAFLTASLHVLSPAGLFLSAPYGESGFSFLSFTGYLLFVCGSSHKEQNVLADLSLVLSGVLLGCATTIRGNGLLNGIVFLEEAAIVAMSLSSPTWLALRRLAALGIGGLFIALGFAVPQVAAYLEYCGNPFSTINGEVRPWCSQTVPSIYGFVQSHYWNTGFLRYWTVSNAPLFLLAAPVLTITITSALSVLCSKASFRSVLVSKQEDRSHRYDMRAYRLLRSLAIPQLVLAILALFNFHVQIITRISSGYPVWYMWLAYRIIEETKPGSELKRNSYETLRIKSAGVAKFLMIYAIVQGGLFASFLPPA